ncbi:MAG: family 1 glycosylhydrolase, partial [Balneolales bacterium]
SERHEIGGIHLSRAIREMRAVNPDHQLGVTCDFTKFDAATDSKEDTRALEILHDYHNKLFLEPWIHGSIPESADILFKPYGMEWSKQELANLAVPLDFLGVNYYRRSVATAAEDGFLNAHTLPAEGEITDMGWQVYPEGLYDTLKWVYETTNLPLYITENGSAYDYPVVDGKINDIKRTEYLRSHLEACGRAIQNGVDLRGYFAWSLLDNFEWERGYGKRFGMIHVDYETQERIIKDSGHYYSDLIKRHGVNNVHAMQGERKAINSKTG